MASPKSVAEKVLAQLLASDSPPACIVLVSPDRLRRDRAITEFKKQFKLLPKRYHGKSLDKGAFSRIAEDLQTISIFENTSSVIIEGAEELQAKLAPQVAALVSRLTKGSILFVSMERRPKSTAVWNAFSSPNCYCLEFPVFKDGGSGRDQVYNSWFQSELGRYVSSPVPQGLTSFLWDVAEGDIDRVALMIQQLTLFCDEGHISLDAAHQLFPYSATPRVFDLTDALLEGDRSRAMRIITELAPGKDACFALLGLLSKMLSRLISLQDLESKRVAVSHIRKQLKLEHDRAYALHRRAVARYPRSKLLNQLELVVRTDARLKNASLTESALLGHLIVGLSG